MTVVATKISISTTPVRIDTQAEDARGGSCLFITNAAGGDTVYLGASDVADTTGFPLAAGSSLVDELELASDEAIFAVCATAESAVVYVLEAGI